MKAYSLLLITILSFSINLRAQNQFPNTLNYDDAAGSPPADLSAIAWLAGHWQGEAFGGQTEELWAPPSGGSMMGAFKLIVGDNVEFYELETISEEAGTLILRLKHFGPDLKGWEERDKALEFRLVKVEPGKVYFEGFTIERISDNEISMYVRIEEGEKIEEVTFPFARAIP